MKREFTRENYNNLVELFAQMDANKTERFAAEAQKVLSQINGALGAFSFLASPISNIFENLRSQAENERKAREAVDRIFKEISSLDSKYRNEVAGYGLTCKALEDLQKAMEALQGANEAGCSAVERGESLLVAFNAVKIKSVMKVPNQELSNRLQAIENGADYNSENFEYIPNGIKKERIKEIEKENPELKEQFEKVLSDSDLTEQEKLDIKYMAYCAPEPYRTIYIEHLDQYTIEVYQKEYDKDGKVKKSGSWFDTVENGIHLEDKDFAGDRRSPYNTIFHESGHAVDDFEDDITFNLGIGTGIISGLFDTEITLHDSSSLTHSYKYNGKTLNELIMADSRDYVNQMIDNDPILKELTPSQREQLLRSVNMTDDASYNYEGSTSGLSPAMKDYSQRLKNIMHDDLAGNDNSAVSDVMGGVTNNALRGDWGHRKEENSNEEFTYWYDGNGNATGHQESELWAEFFAAKMTHDEAELESIRQHFPQAYIAMEKMAEEMAKSGKKA